MIIVTIKHVTKSHLAGSLNSVYGVRKGIERNVKTFEWQSGVNKESSRLLGSTQSTNLFWFLGYPEVNHIIPALNQKQHCTNFTIISFIKSNG